MAKEPTPTPTPSSGPCPTCGHNPSKPVTDSDAEKYKYLFSVIRNTTNGTTDYPALAQEVGTPGATQNALFKRTTRFLEKLGLTKEQIGLGTRRGEKKGVAVSGKKEWIKGEVKDEEGDYY